MDILLHVSGQVKVDDVLDVGDVETSSRYSSGHDDRSLASLEPAESLFSLSLTPVTMNAGDWEPLAVEEVVQLVSAFLSLHEDQGSAGLGTISLTCDT